MAQAALHSESDEDELDEVSEIESLRDEIRDLKISISCILTAQQEHVGRLAGLLRDMSWMD
jgi:hypothetical protein